MGTYTIGQRARLRVIARIKINAKRQAAILRAAREWPTHTVNGIAKAVSSLRIERETGRKVVSIERKPSRPPPEPPREIFLPNHCPGWMVPLSRDQLMGRR